jgi:predicted alpha/beta-hydrolase family hydrolase
MVRAALLALAASAAILVAAGLPASARGGDGPEPAVEEVKIPRPAGTPLAATLHHARQWGKTAVVMSPGQGGGRERPIVKRTAEMLAASGFVVVRFDWSFFTAGGKTPSEDFAAEVADLDAAVAYARAISGVTRVLLAGKSLGVIAIGERLAKHPDDAAGLLLLTPPLRLGDEPWKGAANLLRSKVPTMLLVGDHDDLCPLPVLFEHASKCDIPPRVVVVPGDHGLAKSKDDPKETDANTALAAAATSLWALRFAGP